ncbi:MAG: T9SS type A sorting domain-containing protein [Ignavibacteria bacterium]|nr:T9SS type A sorting domain-containing protein [Ignavibacteria bacterium]
MKLYFFMLLLLPSVIFTQNSDWSYRNPSPQIDFYAIKFFDQNTGYVIGAGGTFLKNVSGSNNWVSIPTQTTSDLYAMYFFDVNTGYLAGAGGLILHTSNGGINWTSIASNNGYAFRSIIFINQTTGFAAGDHGELFKTTSGITGWQPYIITTTNLRYVYFYDSLTGYVCGDSGRVLKTTNCGVNWSMQTIGTADLLSVSFVNSLTGYMTVKPSGVLKTTDGGSSWNSVNLFIQGNDNYLKFINSNTGYIVGKNGPISRTTNGGLNWNTWCSYQLFSGNTYYDISHVDSITAYVCGANGWIFRCNDVLPNTNTKFLGGSKANLKHISFTDPLNGGMISAESSLLFTTSNGGNKWNIQFCGNNSWFEGSSSLTKLWIFSPASWYREIFSPGIGGFSSYSIQQSTDQGLTWAGSRYFFSIGFGVGDVFETGGVTYVTYNLQVQKNTGTGWTTLYTGESTGKIYFADTNAGFVSTYTSGLKSVLYTSNGGSNWVNYSTGSTKRVESVFLRSSGLGFVGCDSALLLKTTNFGLNFSQIPVPNNLLVQNIRFANENTGWFIGTERNLPNTGRLFVSNNGGTSFQQMMSLMNFDVKGYSFIDAQNGFICGDSGKVLRTTNGGLTFVSITGGNIPEKYSLSQNYPNPFNPVTNIQFEIPLSRGVSAEGGRGVFVKLVVYDLLGREITTLVNETMLPGSYTVEWDASNHPSGVYFYTLVTNDYTLTRKMVLLK